MLIFWAMLADWMSIIGREKFLNTRIAADFDTAFILKWGGDYGPLSLRGEFWRLITSVFLHFNFVHLALNMLFLWRLGKPLDRIFGRAQALAIFLVTGAAASLASLAWHPMDLSAGSSGAIHGQGGVLIALLVLARPRLNLSRRDIIVTLIWLVLLVPFGVLSGHPSKHTDYAAHVGGVVSGLLVGAALAGTLRLSQAEGVHQQNQLLRFGAVALVAVLAFVTQRRSHAVTEPVPEISFATPGSDSPAGKSPVKQVFLNLKGDPKLVHRFSTFLNLELEEDGIAIAKDRTEADAVINGEVHIKAERRDLAFRVIEMQITANGDVERSSSCTTVRSDEDDDFFKTSARDVARKLRDKYPDARTVSLDTASDMTASTEFGKDFLEQLKTSGFTVAPSTPADVAVRIKLAVQKVSVDENSTAYDIKAVSRNGTGLFNSHGSGVTSTGLADASQGACAVSWMYRYQGDPLLAAARDLANSFRTPNTTVPAGH
jgi:membrane associated rhomboid family serine protease